MSDQIIDFRNFFQQIALSPLSHWLETLPLQLKTWQLNPHGEYEKWLNSIKFLPEIHGDEIDFTKGVSAMRNLPLTKGEREGIIFHLMQLKPWRKGPFDLYGVKVDCEWRSDLKWQRLLPHISSLKNKLILDVGCGSGYHLWRMVGEGAKLAVGIDPTVLFLCQFEAIRKLLNNDQRAHLIPLGIEDMQPLQAFDTVFSMGVLYHRRSPFEHLQQLKNQLKKGGELVLETLVVAGDENTVLVPSTSYAKMKNIYFIPSVLALSNWLTKVGFNNIRCVDISTTTSKEQRKTEWLDNESLVDFLNPTDPTRTVEGYPAPVRAIFLAKK